MNQPCDERYDELTLRRIDPAMNNPAMNQLCNESTHDERLCDESTHGESTL
jgi:hypothetical protein